MRRRHLIFGLAAAAAAPCVLALAGCGNASNIEPGVPANVQPPADFDPGGDATPDMSGKKAGKAAKTNSPVP